jgi:hypothetical protein
LLALRFRCVEPIVIQFNYLLNQGFKIFFQGKPLDPKKRRAGASRHGLQQVKKVSGWIGGYER